MRTPRFCLHIDTRNLVPMVGDQTVNVRQVELHFVISSLIIVVDGSVAVIIYAAVVYIVSVVVRSIATHGATAAVNVDTLNASEELFGTFRCWFYFTLPIMCSSQSIGSTRRSAEMAVVLSFVG